MNLGELGPLPVVAPYRGDPPLASFLKISMKRHWFRGLWCRLTKHEWEDIGDSGSRICVRCRSIQKKLNFTPPVAFDLSTAVADTSSLGSEAQMSRYKKLKYPTVLLVKRRGFPELAITVHNAEERMLVRVLTKCGMLEAAMVVGPNIRISKRGEREWRP
jgi:hypothetical protein